MKYAKTEAGQQAFKTRSVPLTPRQRSAFILFDGKRTLAEVLASTSGLGTTADDIDQMVALGLLEPITEAVAAPVTTAATAAAGGIGPTAAVGSMDAQARYMQAYPIATRLTAELGLRGFRLNLAVEAADSYHKLIELAPKIRESVSPEKYQALQKALFE